MPGLCKSTRGHHRPAASSRPLRPRCKRTGLRIFYEKQGPQVFGPTRCPAQSRAPGTPEVALPRRGNLRPCGLNHQELAVGLAVARPTTPAAEVRRPPAPYTTKGPDGRQKAPLPKKKCGRRRSNSSSSPKAIWEVNDRQSSRLKRCAQPPGLTSKT